MKLIVITIFSAGAALAQTNTPAYSPRPTLPQVHSPQPAQPLRPADPFAAPPPATPLTPATKPRFTPPPTARDISANVLKPANQSVTLPSLPTASAGATNNVVETVGSEQGIPLTNRPPRTTAP